MSNPFQLNFTLKQHTPLLHFHDQTGATLRATEVKPKLDKYIVEKAFKDDYDQVKTYLIGYREKDSDKLKDKFLKEGYRALDYKLILDVEDDWLHDVEILKTINNEVMISQHTGKVMKDGFPLFFANMGEEGKKNPKNFVFSKNLNGRFFSFNNDILNLLAEYFAEFLIHHSFGTRQSKGFGCFTLYNSPEFKTFIPVLKYKFSIVVDSSSSQFQKDYKKYIEDFKIKFPNSSWNKKERELRGKEYFIYKALFSKLDFFYKSLRSGINQHGFYFKALIFLYAKNKMKVQWDKKSIKQKYFLRYPDNDSLEAQQKRHPSNTYSEALHYNNSNWKLVKDLFGLSSREEWKNQRATMVKVNVEYKGRDSMGKDIFKDKKTDGPKFIARFKSPLHFFIERKSELEFDIHFETNDFPKGYLGEWFAINKVNNNGEDKKYLNLQLPKSSEYSWDDFFSYILNKSNFDISTYVEKPTHEIAIELEKNFNHIRQNLNKNV